MAATEGLKSPIDQLPDPAPLRTIRKQLSWLLAVLLLFAVLGGGVWLGSYAFSPSVGEQETTVLIPKGVGLREIRSILAQHHLLADDFRFLLLASLTGTAGHLRAGEYLIAPHSTPLRILRLLEQGNVIRKSVTIPEGLNIEQIAAILARDGWIDAERFIALTRDRRFIQTLGFNQASLEGYIFPDTYLLTRGDVSEQSLLRMMTKRFKDVWQSLTANMTPSMPRHQTITLASIVEKETGAAGERPIIAGVFLNRLARNMRLQSDPTVIYGLEKFDGDLTKKNLRTESEYNTYIIDGLPPGPICSPGRLAIEAALRPANTPFIFFVSKNDGAHQFSATLNEHNQAVYKYQKKRDKEEKMERVAEQKQEN